MKIKNRYEWYKEAEGYVIGDFQSVQSERLVVNHHTTARQITKLLNEDHRNGKAKKKG